MTTYEVFYYAGDVLGLKTKVDRGEAALDESALRVDGSNGVSIPLREIGAVKLFRLHGLGGSCRSIIQAAASSFRSYVS